MNSLLQPGHHPDAEQLSAFTDHALPPHEQQQVLAHLNGCRDCRDRVYLAQQINPAMFPQPRPASLPHSRFAGWFSGWRLALPAVALACLILLTIHLRKTPAPRDQSIPNNSAFNTPAQPPLSAASPAKPLAVPSSPVSASPKSSSTPGRMRPQPIDSDQTTATAAASPPVPTAHDTPLSLRPLQSEKISVGASGVGIGGGIQGTISDPSGAGIPKAEVVATNTDTGAQTTKLTSNTGTYQISALQPGPYNVEVVAKGFQKLLQENVTIDASQLLGLNLRLPVGGENTTVTVADAPPSINTTDATLGGTIENELYSQLPLSMNGGPRDPTAFQYLMPGVQQNPASSRGAGANNGNSGIYGGTGQTNLNENYIEGVPVSNIAQQDSSNPTSAARTAPIKPLPTLPSKLPALSVVERAGRTLAIDTAGSLFRSDDAGVTWHLVPTQWQGRALTVHLAQPPSAPQPEAATNAAGASSQPQAIAPAFEVTTDSGARYTSPDGQTWHRE